ncbi:predicted protein, partial [Naegleria gruberi]
AQLAPIFGPLGVSPRRVGDQLAKFVKSLNWTAKHIRVRFIIKTFSQLDLELAEHSPLTIISNLAEPQQVALGTYAIHDGNLTFDQVIQIAQSKKPSKTARNLTAKVKEVLGTCVSIGCTVNGEEPRMVLMQINNGSTAYQIPES